MKYSTYISIAIILIAMIGTTNALLPVGAVMAVDINGDAVNLFPGTSIYIKGVNLAPNELFSWEIYDMEDPSCVPRPVIGCGVEVNSGVSDPRRTDTGGDIKDPYHPAGWSIPDPDTPGHKYKLMVTIGYDKGVTEFYTKIDTLEPVPEFNTAILTSIGILGLIFVSRKYKN